MSGSRQADGLETVPLTPPEQVFRLIAQVWDDDVPVVASSSGAGARPARLPDGRTAGRPWIVYYEAADCCLDDSGYPNPQLPRRPILLLEVASDLFRLGQFAFDGFSPPSSIWGRGWQDVVHRTIVAVAEAELLDVLQANSERLFETRRLKFGRRSVEAEPALRDAISRVSQLLALEISKINARLGDRHFVLIGGEMAGRFPNVLPAEDLHFLGRGRYCADRGRNKLHKMMNLASLVTDVRFRWHTGGALLPKT